MWSSKASIKLMMQAHLVQMALVLKIIRLRATPMVTMLKPTTDLTIANWANIAIPMRIWETAPDQVKILIWPIQILESTMKCKIIAKIKTQTYLKSLEIMQTKDLQTMDEDTHLRTRISRNSTSSGNKSSEQSVKSKFRLIWVLLPARVLCCHKFCWIT